MQLLSWSHGQQAFWPCLTSLDLADNNLDSVAMTALSKGSRCKTLCKLMLDGNALGEQGISALGLGKWQCLIECSLKHCSISSHAAVAGLAQVQFPSLLFLHLTGLEAGAVAWLSEARWPSLELVSLGFHDLDKHDCDLLGI